jgi:transposase-like protein
MKGRKWMVEEKLAITIEGIKGCRSVAELCREHQIAQTQYYQWRDRFLEGGKKGLMKGVVNEDVRLKQENDKLKRIIGEQTMVIEVLKKTDEIIKGR